ncbi:MAG: alternate F1F0 ATPase, F1 subunit alpha [Desulfobacterales bacterium]
MNENTSILKRSLDGAAEVIENAGKSLPPELTVQNVGTITYIGPGIIRATGLSGVRNQEMIRLPGAAYGIAFDLRETETGIVLLDDNKHLAAGNEVYLTGEILTIPVGESLLGRIVNGMGETLDDGMPIKSDRRYPLEKPAPSMMDRLPVTVPLQTGIKIIDALIPIGRGQRQLIIGDRQTGKTAIALDIIINQNEGDMVCIYCGIGKRASAVAKLIDDLRRYESMKYSVAVVSTEEDPPGLQYITPYAAMAVGEFFMDRGMDVLVVLDDLTRHARAYREIALLLRRPPGREAFPGDIFYIHSRLLERSTHLKKEGGGGSLSTLPIVETEAQNISAYIPTNLISITDGQIYLSPDLFRKGILPAVDVGRSVSRVGGKTQLPAFRTVSGDLRLAYSQFEELETFARFGTQMDEETRSTLVRGRRIREAFKQPQYHPMPVCEQIAALVSLNEGIFDAFNLNEVPAAIEKISREVSDTLPEVCRKIESGEKIGDAEIEALIKAAQRALHMD